MVYVTLQVEVGKAFDNCAPCVGDTTKDADGKTINLFKDDLQQTITEISTAKATARTTQRASNYVRPVGDALAATIRLQVMPLPTRRHPGAEPSHI